MDASIDLEKVEEAVRAKVEEANRPTFEELYSLSKGFDRRKKGYIHNAYLPHVAS